MIPDHAIVMRFRPTDPDRVLAQADKEYRNDSAEAGLIPHFGLSVWVGVPTADEPVLDTLKRLARAADIRWEGQKRVFVATRAERLVNQGFTFFKDCFAGEPAEHFCVRLPSLELDTVKRFLQAFDSEYGVAELGVSDEASR